MHSPVIELGLVVAGSASAGAYSAGVLDFLIEALSAYDEARTGAAPSFQPVTLRVIAGSGSGGLNAALLAAALENGAPDGGLSEGGAGGLKKLWIDELDASALLGKGSVQTLFDGKVLDRFAKTAFARRTGVTRPGFISDTLDIAIAYSDLNGTGDEYHRASLHKDGPGVDWQGLHQAALASAALPGFFPVHRNKADGGALNADPLMLARAIFENNASGAAHLIIAIDPVPRIDKIEAGPLLGLLTALRRHTAIKDISRVFHIAPSGAEGGDGHHLAGDAAAGLAGYLEKTFRQHDFTLGRRNAQRFLARHFALPPTHPAVADWTQAMDEAHGIWPKGVARSFPAPLRPVIPLVGSAAKTIETPGWPAVTPKALARIEKLLARRFGQTGKALASHYIDGALARSLAGLLTSLQKAKAARMAMSQIRLALGAQGLIAGQAKPKPKTAKAAAEPAKTPKFRVIPKTGRRKPAGPIQTVGWGRSIDGIDEPDLVR